jgi:hypothetical protein
MKHSRVKRKVRKGGTRRCGTGKKRGGGEVRINVYDGREKNITSVLIVDTNFDVATKEINVDGTRIIEDTLNKEHTQVFDYVPYYKIDSKCSGPITAFSSTPIGMIDEVHKNITSFLPASDVAKGAVSKAELATDGIPIYSVRASTILERYDKSCGDTMESILSCLNDTYSSQFKVALGLNENQTYEFFEEDYDVGIKLNNVQKAVKNENTAAFHAKIQQLNNDLQLSDGYGGTALVFRGGNKLAMYNLSMGDRIDCIHKIDKLLEVLHDAQHNDWFETLPE